MEISVGHTPDSDDAFMFYAMFTGKVASPDFTVKHVIEDIEQLNKTKDELYKKLFELIDNSPAKQSDAVDPPYARLERRVMHEYQRRLVGRRGQLFAQPLQPRVAECGRGFNVPITGAAVAIRKRFVDLSFRRRHGRI